MEIPLGEFREAPRTAGPSIVAPIPLPASVVTANVELDKETARSLLLTLSTVRSESPSLETAIEYGA